MAASNTSSARPARRCAMRRRARLGRAAGLDDDHRLVARRRARGRHEFARLRRTRCTAGWRGCGHRCPGSPARRQSPRRRCRPARRSAKSRSGAAVGPVQHGGGQRARLRGKRQRARLRAGMWAKLAFSPRPGTSRPRQLGPRMRSSHGRAASSMACFCSAVRPALMTTAAACRARQFADQRHHGVRAGCRSPPARASRAGRPRWRRRLRMLMGNDAR
jgi:hypothetical protein